MGSPTREAALREMAKEEFQWHEWKGGVFRPFGKSFKVEIELRNGMSMTGLCNKLDWKHDGDGRDIIRWRRLDPLTDKEAELMGLPQVSHGPTTVGKNGDAEGRDRIGSAADRKAAPVVSGFIDYFPDAMIEVAKLSQSANEQHNPGEPMHWARGKSADHADCEVRHLIDRGKFDSDGVRHSVKKAWRAMADLQIELEQDLGLPLPRGARR